MVDDLDIQRCAWLLIQRHGRNALAFSGGRHVELYDQGDIEGARVWLRIDNAIVDLLFPEYVVRDETRPQH